MVIVKGVSLGSRVEDPGRICKRISPDSLYMIGYIDPIGVAVHPTRHHWGWYPLCANVSGYQVITFS